LNNQTHVTIRLPNLRVLSVDGLREVEDRGDGFSHGARIRRNFLAVKYRRQTWTYIMKAGRFGPPPATRLRECFSPKIPCPCGAPILAPTARRPAFPRLAKKILDDYWSFHPTTAAAFGIHRYDGMLPVYTAATLRAFTTRVREYIDALDRLDRGDGLTRKVRLRLGVLRGLLLTELSEIEDERLP